MVSNERAIDSRALAIGVLSITACILFVGLMLMMLQPRPAYAIGQVDRSGDYIMATQQLSSSQEACVVIDAASRNMGLYLYNASNRQIQMLQRISLNEMPTNRP